MALAIEAIDEQFITIGTKDYDLIIDITGDPDTVEATGHMEGFSQHWDAANAQLHIRADEVTRLIAGVFWTVEIRKGTQVLTADIAYQVIPAAPILEALPMIHLYKGVPIKVDVVIENIPPLIIPNARLLGLKSELVEYGVNVGGKIPRDANLTLNSGDVTLMIPSDTGETSDMHDYPYVIEPGNPPSIGTPKFIPKGSYGEITFDDVNHALGYEWTLETADAATWNFFNNSRNTIDPSTVEITPGNLNVTIKFPNIAGASSYEYMLESEVRSSAWIRFTGTFENGMITTIIPDLEEGVEYTLRLRVASPWIGTPISVTVYGGRIAYIINRDRTVGNSALYIFTTATKRNSVASTIKKILLPTGNDDPVGIAIIGTTAYCLDDDDRAIYVFSTETAHNSRATQMKKIMLPGSGNTYDVAAYNNILYVYGYDRYNSISYDIFSMSPDTADGATASIIERWDIYIANLQGSPSLSVDEDFIYIVTTSNRLNGLYTFPRTIANRVRITAVLSRGLPVDNKNAEGVSVIGTTGYTVDTNRNIYIFDTTQARPPVEEIINIFQLPVGVNSPKGFDTSK